MQWLRIPEKQAVAELGQAEDKIFIWTYFNLASLSSGSGSEVYQTGQWNLLITIGQKVTWHYYYVVLRSG